MPQATEDSAPSQSDEPAAPQTPEGDQDEARSLAEVTHKLRPLVGLVVGVIAVVVLAAAGLIAFLSMGDSDATDDGVAVAAMGAAPPPAESKTPAVGPSMWRQPDWADAAGGVTAFELAANGDVPFANGRFRPTLGVSCAAGETEVHLTTGGTAIIDPQNLGTHDEDDARRAPPSRSSSGSRQTTSERCLQPIREASRRSYRRQTRSSWCIPTMWLDLSPSTSACGAPTRPLGRRPNRAAGQNRASPHPAAATRPSPGSAADGGSESAARTQTRDGSAPARSTRARRTTNQSAGRTRHPPER